MPVSLIQNQPKENLLLPKMIQVPNGIKSFSFTVGDTSTKVDTSASNDEGTQEPSQRSICQTPDGYLHMTWRDAGFDVWYGYNPEPDGSGSWTTWQIFPSTYYSCGIVCSDIQTNSYYNLTIYCDDSNTVKMFVSDDQYNSSDAYTWTHGTSANNNYAAIDSQGFKHHVNAYVSLYTLSTENYTQYTVHDDSNNDSDDSMIEVGTDDTVWIAGVGTDKDALDIWHSSKGYGTENRIRVLDAGSFVAPDNVDIAVRRINGIDQIWTCTVFGSDLWVCNSTENNYETEWDCTDVPTSLSPEYCDIGVLSDGRVEVVWPDTVNDKGWRSNSTNGVDWDEQQIEAGDFLNGGILDANWPASSRMDATDGYVRYVYSNNTDVWFGTYDIISGEVEDTPTPVSYTHLTLPTN